MSIANQEFAPIARKGGISEDVVHRIIAAVFDGHLKAGDRLVVQQLAQQLGVSATPVREAIVTLANMGVVELLHNRGAVCCPFGPQQLREIYQIRRLLEMEAARCACDSLNRGDLETLKEDTLELRNSQGSDEAWSARAIMLDRRLHELIYHHSGSQRLINEIARYDVLMHVIRKYVDNRHDIQRAALEDHLHIIEALMNCNPKLAAQKMGEHIRSTCSGVEQLMFGKEL